MFEATFKTAALFKKLIESIAGLVGEINFNVDKDGITAQQMDTSHVGLVYVVLSVEAFEKYRCDRPLVIGIDLAGLNHVLKMIPASSKLELVHNEKGNKLVLSFYNGYEAEVTLHCIDFAAELLGIPDAEYGIEIDASAEEYSHLINNFCSNGECLKIEVVDGIVIMSAEGEKEDSLRIRFVDSENKNFVCQTNYVIRIVRLALKMLKKMTHTKLSDRVIIKIDDDKPVQITYTFGTEGALVGLLQYFLAPKIEDEQ